MKSFRDRLRGGAPAIGCCITYPSPGVVESIGGDWDWMWVDAQHGQLGYQDVLALVRACDQAGTEAFVRVPANEGSWILRALDSGARGVIIPQVEDADQAARAVKTAKFAPVGRRSFGGRRVIDLAGRAYAATANADTLLMVQLESPGALDRAGEIAAVEGVDILLAGPDDVSLVAGESMTEPRDLDMVRGWLQMVIDACRQCDKFAGAFAMDARTVELAVSMGFDMIACGADLIFLAEGSKTAANTARQIIARS